MSDSLDDLLGDNSSGSGDGQPKGNGLRAQLEAVLAERKQLAEELGKLKVAQRQRDLDGLFDKHKIPSLAKDFFPADAELDDKAAAAFVERYGALWGATAPDAATTPEAQAATTAIQQVASQATSPALKPLSEDEYRAKFDQAKNMSELRQLMDGLGSMQV